jgi:hypothetical protein
MSFYQGRSFVPPSGYGGQITLSLAVVIAQNNILRFLVGHTLQGSYTGSQSIVQELVLYT